MKTRSEHLAQSKVDALRYAVQGGGKDALACIASDLDKHPETADHKGLELGMMLLIGGQLETPDQIRRFINGFN